jgi:hypothetical protein
VGYFLPIRLGFFMALESPKIIIASGFLPIFVGAGVI